MSDYTRRDIMMRGIWLSGGAAALAVARPRAAAAAAASEAPLVLSPSEWRAADAICSRLIPTDHEPGAREAQCVNFIDKALAHEDRAMRPIYAAGLAGVDAVAQRRNDALFADLSAHDQDGVLRMVEDGEAVGWPDGGVAPQAFFSQIWAHTVWGFLAEPVHGGNQAYAGWRVLGYPGGRHRHGGYTPKMMMGAEPVVAAWGEALTWTSKKE